MLEATSPYVCSATGFVLWLALNRRDVPGDYFLLAAAAYTGIVASLLTFYGIPNATFAAFEHTAASLLSLALSTIAYRLSPFHPLAAYPGPFLWRVSSLALAFSSWNGHRHLVFEELHHSYGKFVRIGPNALSISDASELLNVYGAKYHMAKPDAYKIPGRNPAHAMFFQQTREVHAARKQIWQQAFTPASLESYIEPLERHVRRLARAIEGRSTSEGIVNLSDCLCHWAYDVMGDITFGGSNGLSMLKNGDPEGLIEGGKIATALLDSFGQTPWVMDIAWHVAGLGPIKKLQALAASMVHARLKATDVKVVDIMHYLLKGDPRTGEEISVSDLKTDAIVAIQGGSDNTSTTLIIAMYFLICNPLIYQRLQQEVEEKFSENGGDATHKMLASIPLLDAVIHEALRFGSPYYLPRVVPPGGAFIGGQLVPAGTIVASASHAQQMSEDNFYPHPHSFMPDRWLPGGLGPGAVLNRAAIASFTFGPHVCIGKVLAMQEMRVCLAHLVTTFDMQLPTGKDDDGEFYRGLRNMRTTLFDKPLIVRATRREGKSVQADL